MDFRFDLAGSDADNGNLDRVPATPDQPIFAQPESRSEGVGENGELTI